MQDIFSYIDDHAEEYLESLFVACRQPSISSQNVGIREMAHLVNDMFTNVGLKSEILETENHPLVYAESEGYDSVKTLTCYNHYDVQPPEPLDEWLSEPFSPEIRDGRIYARGVADNKGNIIARLSAIDAWLKVRGTLPVKMKFIVDGEEEIGSPNLKFFPDMYPDKLATDGILWEGGSKDVGGPVHVSLGVKGMLYVEMRVRTAASDLHSSNAAIVDNPAWILVRALNTLKDADGNIMINGFNDKVVPETDLERHYLEKMFFDEKATLEFFGIEKFLDGVSGYELKRRNLFAPTCNIAGIIAGYTGEGAKTVLPGSALVKMDLRLVPNQDPEEILSLLRNHLDRHGFENIELVVHSTAHPFKTSPDHPLASSVIKCAKTVYGTEPIVYVNCSGTSPIYSLCKKTGIGAVQVGVANEDCRAHAPNENIFVQDYIDGIKLIAAVMDDFSRV